MIFVTGDCHSDFRKFNTELFPEQKKLTKNDYVIICGDFGGLWDQEESKNEKYWLDWLENRPFTTLFVDGNHENFKRLSELPEVDFCGGKVGMVRPSVLHLKRGEIYNLGGVKTLAFGGARSHDISDGILDSEDPKWKEKAIFLESRGKYMYRVKGLSWWEEELPTEEEMEHARESLEKHKFNVDLIVSHCCPSSVQSRILPYGEYDVLTDFLNELKVVVDYKKWYFGHYHGDCPIDEKHGLLYRYILPWDTEVEQGDTELLYS
jgi:hypothetical protein